ncbi:MAG: APC family permease [Holophagae bacterium]
MIERTGTDEDRSRIGFLQAVAMAVGTMIGASIFSVFGVGARIARQNLPEAFLLSGALALIVGYSYAKLGPHIISNAGPIAFILKGIGDNVVTGALSVLLWLTYVVSVAMFARGIAGYFLPLVGLPDTAVGTAALVVAVVVLFTVLSFFGSEAVGRAEFWIVLVKLAILGVFIAAGMVRIATSRVAPSLGASHIGGMLHAGVLFFLSYMGFGLITNIGENLRNAKRVIPRAIYTSIGIALFVYVSVAVVAVGNLPPDRLVQVGENALAVAAEPFLGSFGFVLISIGALFSISSALNATLYGGANIAYALAKDGELPELFERKVWFGSTEGLYITAALSVAFALLFDMNGIASITSSVFTVIYIFVLVAHLRLADEVGGNRVVLVVNLVVLVAVFLALLFFQYLDNPTTLVGTALVLAAALAIEAVYRYWRKREFRTRELTGETASQR